MSDATPTTPKSDAPARIPITEEECRALARAMHNPAVAGNLATAAKLLGINYQRAFKIAQKESYIRAMQPAVDATTLVPSSAESIDRAPMGSIAIAEAQAMERQEKLLSVRNWTALGISEDQAKRMISMERFANLPLSHSIKATHGGLMMASSILLGLIEKYGREIQNRSLPTETVMINGEPMPRDEGDIERDWANLLVTLIAEERQINAQLIKGSLTLMKARQIEREIGRGDKGKGKKPLGPPMQILAQPGSTVNVNDNKVSGQ